MLQGLAIILAICLVILEALIFADFILSLSSFRLLSALFFLPVLELASLTSIAANDFDIKFTTQEDVKEREKAEEIVKTSNDPKDVHY